MRDLKNWKSGEEAGVTIIIKDEVGINNIELKRKLYLHVQNSLKRVIFLLIQSGN